ncbi:hypothetical protein D0867_12152 [Hortaea werneckii]|uniref:Uncharacterized protein n=1 Tax=Hortaea werneckii TaxID=91943 RepID=A0A3M6ZTK3_HORWE|nr:hypothetical protein D0867_12152 [Hortaea werneckii]RMY18399.1 hypothetical protein D0866_13182 [Hortaea werneckii]
MNPEHLLTEDRPLFEAELEGMIADAAAPRAPTRTTPPEAPSVSDAIHRKRSNPSTWESESESPALKRPRTDGQEQELPLRITDSARSKRGDLVHPPKASLLNQRINDSPIQTTRHRPPFVHRLPPTLPHLEGHRLSNPTEATSRKAVHRPWVIQKDDQKHDELSNLRRREGLRDVNRYVPALGSSSHHDHAFAPSKLPSRSQERKPSPLRRLSFSELPPKIRDRIYKLLLTKDEPIQIDLTWLRPFINGHARIPAPAMTVRHEKSEYQIPVPFDRLVQDVALMQGDMKPYTAALENKVTTTHPSRAPVRGLATPLLRVAKKLHEEAARVLYAHNTFSFPRSTTAWMLLESFLATIGKTNIAHLHKIDIRVPMWHLGVQADFVEGAILNLILPAVQMTVRLPPAHDRLLSAIKYVTEALTHAHNLQHLVLGLEYGRETDIWTERYHNTCSLISVSDAEEFATRRKKGTELLHQLSDTIPSRPKLRVFTTSEMTTRQAKEGFKEEVPRIQREAAKYGWVLEEELQI